MRGRLILAMVALLSGPAWPVAALITNLTSSADTSIISSYPENNSGSLTHVGAGTDGFGGVRRGLFLFDVASVVPAGAIINSATLTLTVPGGNEMNPTFFDLHRLLVDWGEGSQVGMNGGQALTGDATWFYRHYATVSWGINGGAGGTDYASAVSAATFVNTIGSYTWNSAALTADVQLWVDDPAANYGWLLMSESEGTATSARRFASREDAANAPQLLIDFTVIPEPASLWLVGGATILLLVMRARNGRN